MAARKPRRKRRIHRIPSFKTEVSRAINRRIKELKAQIKQLKQLKKAI